MNVTDNRGEARRIRRGKLIDQGFSLVELMIAMALGLAAAGAVALLSVNATRSYRATNQANQQLENGRYALSILKDDLEHAGFYGSIAPVKLTLPESSPDDPCDRKPQTHANSLLMPVRVYSASPGSNCNSYLAGRVSGTRVLVIRRADTVTTTAAGSEATGHTYIQTTPDRYIIACVGCSNAPESAFKLASNGPAGGFSLRRPNDESRLADIRRYHVHIYFIRSWATTSGDGIPTLVRVSLSRYESAPAMTSEPMIEGIENLQFQLGLDAAVGTACPYADLPADCDGAPLVYVPSTDAALAALDWRDWANVVTVRVNVLARSLDPERNYTDNKTYDLGNGDGNLFSPPSNALHYPRHVFSQLVRIHHPGGWRDREK